MPPGARCVASLVTLVGMAAVSVGAGAEEKFQRLNGVRIQSRLAGMEMTDGVHFSDVFERTGLLKGYAMGRSNSGKWRIENNQLCLDRGKQPGGGCFEVWLSGKNVELRNQGSIVSQEGILQNPRARK